MFYSLSGLIVINFIISIRQFYLIRKLFKDKVHNGFELYKFLWPFWKKEILVTQYGQTELDKVLIKKLILLRTISVFTFLPVIIIITTIVIVLILVMGIG